MSQVVPHALDLSLPITRECKEAVEKNPEEVGFNAVFWTGRACLSLGRARDMRSVGIDLTGKANHLWPGWRQENAYTERKRVVTGRMRGS